MGKLWLDQKRSHEKRFLLIDHLDDLDNHAISATANHGVRGYAIDNGISIFVVFVAKISPRKTLSCHPQGSGRIDSE